MAAPVSAAAIAISSEPSIGVVGSTSMSSRTWVYVGAPAAAASRATALNSAGSEWGAYPISTPIPSAPFGKFGAEQVQPLREFGGRGGALPGGFAEDGERGLQRRVGHHPQQHLGPGCSPRGGEAEVQRPTGRGRLRVRSLDRHQAGLEVERGRHPVHRLQPLTRDRVHVAVQIDEAGADDEAGHIDDRGAVRRGQVGADSTDRRAIHEHVRDAVEAGPRVDHPTAA